MPPSTSPSPPLLPTSLPPAPPNSPQELDARREVYLSRVEEQYERRRAGREMPWVVAKMVFAGLLYFDAYYGRLLLSVLMSKSNAFSFTFLALILTILSSINSWLVVMRPIRFFNISAFFSQFSLLPRQSAQQKSSYIPDVNLAAAFPNLRLLFRRQAYGPPKRSSPVEHTNDADWLLAMKAATMEETTPYSPGVTPLNHSLGQASSVWSYPSPSGSFRVADQSLNTTHDHSVNDYSFYSGAESPPPQGKVSQRPLPAELMMRLRRARSAAPVNTLNFSPSRKLKKPERHSVLRESSLLESSRKQYEVSVLAPSRTSVARRGFTPGREGSLLDASRKSSRERSVSVTRGSSVGPASGPDEKTQQCLNRYFDFVQRTTDVACQEMRQWIAETIMQRVAMQMGVVERHLDSMGRHDLQLGTASLASLEQAVASGEDKLEPLGALLPYLEASSNQSYLVGRLRQLGADSSMAAYKWNGGATQDWSEDLPTDAYIVMHCFARYMDAVLQLNCFYAQFRPFSGKYQRDISTTVSPKGETVPKGSKKNGMSAVRCYITVTTHRPPHFEISVFDGSLSPRVVPVRPGRQNVFECILLFFLFFRVCRESHIEAVSLKNEGLSLNWILDCFENAC